METKEIFERSRQEILKEFLAAHAYVVLGHARNLIEAFSEQLDDWGPIGGVGTWPQAEQFVRDGKAIVALISAQAARIEELEASLRSAVDKAVEAAREWDKAPEGMRAGKILIALSGYAKGYRADIDAIHAILTRSEPRA